MNDQEYCPKCGEALTEEVLGGLCARCVMLMNLSSDTFDTMNGANGSVPPLPPEEMSEMFPQFEIIECLGRGGMGVVYKARQKTLDRIVAIKVLAGEWQGEAGFGARFEREAKTLAQMSHPNIVTVHDFGEADGLYYIVMEFIDGVNLRDLLREEKMEPEQALAIVPPICEALEFAHTKGVVHRDIKPENLLLDRDGRIKIADFGIASLVGATGEKSGTPPYMAPEQEMGVVDRRADIYALGVVLYEMLTGERPEKELVAPSKRVEIDVRLDEIVLRALEKEPGRRYQTADEFRTVVKTMATNTPTEEPPSSREVRPPAVATLQAARLSRMAIAGACWAPLFFFAIAPMFFAFSAAGQSHEPAEWQSILIFTLLPLGLTAPFGTTILGFLALTQIRRSAGKLYGLGLALFDVLLFPLLVLNALIGSLWLLLFKVLPSSTVSGFPPTPVQVLLATLVTVIVTNVLIVRSAWRAAKKPVGDGVPSGATPRTTAPRKTRMKFAVIIGLVIVAVAALFFWAQQPRMIDERAVAADSPDEMFSATGRTYHAKRIFGANRTFYQFQVRGRNGAVFEQWEVPVPHEKLAPTHTTLSRDEILFGKHGRIVWLDDGKRASFQVKNIEVAAFDVSSGKPTQPEDDQAMCERVARDFIMAILRKDVEEVKALLSPTSPIPSLVDLDDWIAKYPATLEEDLSWLTTFTEWLVDGDLAVLRTAPQPEKSKSGAYVELKRTNLGWRVMFFDQAEANKSLRHYLNVARQQAKLEIDMSGQDVTDEILAELAANKNLKRLNLYNSSISDEGLKRLSVLPNLEWLNIGASLTRSRYKPTITDSGMANLSACKSLRHLMMVNLSVTDEGLVHLKDLHELETLNLSSTEVSGPGLAMLPRKLRILFLEKTPLTDEGLRHLSDLPQLEQLHLFGTRISDEGIRHLSALSQLEKLHLRHTQVGDVGISHLAGLSNLRYLDVLTTKVSPSGLDQFRKARPAVQVQPAALSYPRPVINNRQGKRERLTEEIVLGGQDVTDEMLAKLAEHPELKRLNLYDSTISGQALRRLSVLPNLEWLNLGAGHSPSDPKMTLTSSGLSSLAECESLRRLNLNHRSVSDEDLTFLKDLHQLELLELSGTEVSGAGLAMLPRKLRILRLDGTSLTNEGLENLSDLPQLERLSLHGTRITDEGLRHLLSLDQLKVLTLSGTSITDEGVRHLLSLSQLKELWLGGTQVSDVGLHLLAGLPNLIKLDVFGTKITGAGLDQFQGARPTVVLRWPTHSGTYNREDQPETLSEESRENGELNVQEAAQVEGKTLQIWIRRAKGEAAEELEYLINGEEVRSEQISERLKTLVAENPPAVAEFSCEPDVELKHMATLGELVNEAGVDVSYRVVSELKVQEAAPVKGEVLRIIIRNAKGEASGELKCFLDGEEVKHEQMDERLRAILAKNPPASVEISCEPSVELKHVLLLADQVREAGVEVRFRNYSPDETLMKIQLQHVEPKLVVGEFQRRLLERFEATIKDGNVIILATPKSQVEQVRQIIEELDVPSSNEAEVQQSADTPMHQDVELCILRSPETRLAGAIVGFAEGRKTATVANSAHGKQSSFTATFQSSDGLKDKYTAVVKIAGKAPQTFDVIYEGEEIIVHQNDELVMLMRPEKPKVDLVIDGGLKVDAVSFVKNGDVNVKLTSSQENLIRDYLIHIFDSSQFHQMQGGSLPVKSQKQIKDELERIKSGSFIELRFGEPAKVSVENKELRAKRMWVRIRENDGFVYDQVLQQPNGDLVSLAKARGELVALFAPHVLRLLRQTTEDGVGQHNDRAESDSKSGAKPQQNTQKK